MPRTPIPSHLIHRPEEVERNGKRFDYLCRLAEEVALPVIQKGLFREFNETAATGAEILADEAKQALQALAEDAAILEDLDEEKVLEDLQKSLSYAVPPPDNEECRQHTRDFSQVLMSAWLETLRSAQAKVQILELSDCLLPEDHSSGFTWLKWFGSTKSNLPETMGDAVGSFAVNEEDVITILTTLRKKLFAGPRLVDLPFDLAMVGAPEVMAHAASVGGPPARASDEGPSKVMVMKHHLFITLLKEMEQQQRQLQQREREREEREKWWREMMSINPAIGIPGASVPVTALGVPAFVSPLAQVAAANVSVSLPADRYRTFAALNDSQLQLTKIETTVSRAMSAATE
jgi:hypothetical protein